MHSNILFKEMKLNGKFKVYYLTIMFKHNVIFKMFGFNLQNKSKKIGL